jgi:hypothetical protein
MPNNCPKKSCDCGLNIEKGATYPIRPEHNYYSPSKPQTDWSFSRCRDLPPEVLILIWEFALPGARIVLLEARPLISFLCSRVYSDRDVVRYGKLFAFKGDSGLVELRRDVPDDPGELHFRYRYGFKSQSSVVHMEVYKESFRVASKHYTLAFATDLLAPGVWFNFELDTLYLDRGFKQNDSSYYGPRLL